MPMSGMDGFLRYLLKQGLSPTTASMYERCVEKAHRFAATAGGDTLAILRHPGYAKTRRETYKKALLHYARWRGATEFETQVRGVSLRARPGEGKRQHQKVVPSTDEWRAIHKVILEHPNEDLRAALYLLATLGLRIERELLNLTGLQLRIALEKGHVLIEQKGGTWRYLALPTAEQKVQAQVLADQMSDETRLWQLFLTPQRRAQRSVVEFFRRELSLIGAQAGVKLTPHALRHAFADAVYDKFEGNLELVREALGQSSVRTTATWYQDRGHPKTLERLVTSVLDDDEA